jgi:hypothetical protein
MAVIVQTPRLVSMVFLQVFHDAHLLLLRQHQHRNRGARQQQLVHHHLG